jgi:hypothetical protein
LFVEANKKNSFHHFKKPLKDGVLTFKLFMIFSNSVNIFSFRLLSIRLIVCSLKLNNTREYALLYLEEIQGDIYVFPDLSIFLSVIIVWVILTNKYNHMIKLILFFNLIKHEHWKKIINDFNMDFVKLKYSLSQLRKTTIKNE